MFNLYINRLWPKQNKKRKYHISEIKKIELGGRLRFQMLLGESVFFDLSANARTMMMNSETREKLQRRCMRVFCLRWRMMKMTHGGRVCWMCEGVWWFGKGELRRMVWCVIVVAGGLVERFTARMRMAERSGNDWRKKKGLLAFQWVFFPKNFKREERIFSVTQREYLFSSPIQFGSSSEEKHFFPFHLSLVAIHCQLY